MTYHRAIEYGLALGLFVALVVMALPGAGDDFSAVLRVAVREANPYTVDLPACRSFVYPIWNVTLLRLLAVLPREVGLCIVWLVSLGAVLTLSRYWYTPAWVVLVSPVFLCGLFWGQPFEALAFMGLTLILMGRPGLGLCLLIFKPQLAVGAILYVAASSWRSLLYPAGMVLCITTGDWLVTGRLWVFDWWLALRAACLPGNCSLWPSLSLLSFLWVPVTIWFLLRWAKGDARRELWIVTAAGMLMTPYWGAYSLWPLVAMVGGLMGNANSKCKRRITCQDCQLG